MSEVKEDTMRDADMEACILRRVLEMSFIAPSDPIDILFPFVFEIADGV